MLSGEETRTEPRLKVRLHTSAFFDVHLCVVPGECVAPSEPSNLQLLEMPALSQRLPHSCKSRSDSFLWNVIIEDCQELPKGVFKIRDPDYGILGQVTHTHADRVHINDRGPRREP